MKKEVLLMSQKAEYRSSIRSKMLIRRSFIDLLRTKPIEKITVTDVVNGADINRGTFYAHYPDINALIRAIEDEIIETLYDLISSQDMTADQHDGRRAQDPLSLFLKISAYLSENQELIFSLMNANNARDFIFRLPDLFTEHLFSSNDPDQDGFPEAACRFYAAGIAHVYTAWFQGSLNGSLEDIAHHLARIMDGYGWGSGRVVSGADR